MKNIMCLIIFVSFGLYSQETKISILEKTISKLYEIQNVKYQSTYLSKEGKIVYLEQERFIFFDFDTNNETPKYHIVTANSELIYNGKKHYQSLVDENIIIINDAPDANNPLLLTLFAVKKFLPQLMTHNNIQIIQKPDIVINEEKHYVFDFECKNVFIDWQNFKMKNHNGDGRTKYTLTINSSDYLPRKMMMENGLTGNISKTYNNFDFEYTPNKALWSGQLLPKEYSKMTFNQYFENQEVKLQSIKSNSDHNNIPKDIKNWKLPNLNLNSTVDFSKLDGKLVLLEFWFKNCGACVRAVPALNAIHKKYKHENFKLYGIEFNENFPKDNLISYVEKIKMKYPTLYKGKKLASSLSVSSAPTIILINKKGEIIYTNAGFKKDEIIELIEANL